MTSVFLSGCKNHPLSQDPNFKSENIEKTATILLNGNTDLTFPLFGAFEEREWSEGWNPVLIFPATEIIREGTTFITQGHGHGEGEFTWIVNRYNPDQLLIQYLVYTGHRHWTITIKCQAVSTHQTAATITYSFTGHDELGNTISRHLLDKMYSQQLKDWETAINTYLAKIDHP